MIGWLQLMQIIYIINPIVWPRDDTFRWWNGNGLCDVEIRILVGATVGIPGSTMCIVRKLANVLDSKPLILTRAQRNRRMLLDGFLCIGFPIILMIVYYVVQANRYTVLTTTGCAWWIDRSWPSIVLVLIWPLVLAMINAYFAGKL
jgi:pheromone a factor receptor